MLRDVLDAEPDQLRARGSWSAADSEFPAVTRLMRCDASATLDPLARPAVDERFGVLRDMVSAGLLHEGEKLLCLRPGTGVRYEAHVVDGGIQLPDGRWFARPSGALTALGYRHQNGWHYWCRARDGVALSKIRMTPSRRSPALRLQRRHDPHLFSMVADGTLCAGDELRYVQPRKGVVHVAYVLADGQLQIGDGRRFPTPAAAINACHGSLTEGWRTWRRVSDNRTLGELREEHRNRDTRSHTQQPPAPHPSDESGHELPSTPSAT